MGYSLFMLLLYAIPYIIYYLVCSIYIIFMILSEIIGYIINKLKKERE